MNLYAFIDTDNRAVSFVESEGTPEYIPAGCSAVMIPEGTSYGFNWIWNGTQLTPSPAPTVKVPVSITPRQCRLLLLQKGLLAQVVAMIEQQNEDVRITWEYALEFRRDDPLINQLAPVLNFTQEMLDQFFIQASAL